MSLYTSKTEAIMSRLHCTPKIRHDHSIARKMCMKIIQTDCVLYANYSTIMAITVLIQVSDSRLVSILTLSSITNAVPIMDCNVYIACNLLAVCAFKLYWALYDRAEF